MRGATVRAYVEYRRDVSRCVYRRRTPAVGTMINVRLGGTPVMVEANGQEWDGFFTVSLISRLTGIPDRTLYDWRMREIIMPSVTISEGRRVEEGYSYATVTIIRLLRWMRDYHIDFKSASYAFKHLYERLGPPSRKWASEHVYFVGRHIFVEGQDGKLVTDAAAGGQFVMTKLFGDIFAEVNDVAEGESILVPKKFRPFVEINPGVMGGEPVLKGTRVPTSALGSLLASGEPIARIVRLYAPTPRAQIEAGIEYERFLDAQAA